MKASIFLLLFLFQLILGSDITDNRITWARVESCSGCRLNVLREVKRFVKEDIPLFRNADFKHIWKANPELVFFNQDGEEIERIPLSEKSQEECRELMFSRGFYMERPEDAEVLEEAQYPPHQEL